MNILAWCLTQDWQLYQYILNTKISHILIFLCGCPGTKVKASIMPLFVYDMSCKLRNCLNLMLHYLLRLFHSFTITQIWQKCFQQHLLTCWYHVKMIHWVIILYVRLQQPSKCSKGQTSIKLYPCWFSVISKWCLINQFVQNKNI